MLDNDSLVTMDVDPCDIAQLADEDLALAIVAEKKSMEGMTKSDALAWIDKRTRGLQQSIMALTAIRNTLAAVDNLPDELLVEIFTALAFIVRPPFGQMGETGPSAGISWLAVAKVCRRWRNIALWTPKLYSFIDARSVAITRIFLRRSNNVPVNVYMESEASSVDVHGTMTEIKPHFSRVKELGFRARYQSLLVLASHIGSLPAPMLESLHLEQITVRRILALHEAIVIPQIFNGHTPALRRLYLALISIPWTSPIFSGLTELHLLLQHSSTSPSIDTFLQVLENCPLLETLTLVRAGPSLHVDLLEYPPPVQVAELTRLREIYLQLSRPIDTQYVLAHLVIPSTATITICCQLDSDQDFSAVLPRDCGGLSGLSHVRRLRLYVEDIQSIILTGYTESSAKVLSMSLFVGESEGMLKPRLFFSQLGRFFPLSHLEDLQVVNCAAHLSKDKYTEVLSKLPRLTHLTASEKWPARQLQLLTALTISPLGNNAGVVCPSLKVLRFSGLDCKQEVIDEVVNICRFRARNGSTLDAVHIAGLGAQGVLSLLRADALSIVNVDDNWVEEVS
jgi:hypothetical protein